MVATVAGIHLGLDTHSNRPAGNAVPDCSFYSCSTHSLIYKSNFAGNSWATWATLGTSGAYTAGGTDVAIADGGTGQSTATLGFDALSPMTTAGDLIIGGASGTRTRLAAGATSGHVLTSNGSGAAPSWQAASGGGGGSSAPLGVCRYANGTDTATYTIASSTQTDVDATNAIVTFTAPGSGAVVVDVAVLLAHSDNTTVHLGLRESSTDLTKSAIRSNTTGGMIFMAHRSWYLTGISAGSHTYKLAWSRQTSGTTTIYTGPLNGAVEMTVWAA